MSLHQQTGSFLPLTPASGPCDARPERRLRRETGTKLEEDPSAQEPERSGPTGNQSSRALAGARDGGWPSLGCWQRAACRAFTSTHRESAVCPLPLLTRVHPKCLKRKRCEKKLTTCKGLRHRQMGDEETLRGPAQRAGGQAPSLGAGMHSDLPPSHTSAPVQGPRPPALCTAVDQDTALGLASGPGCCTGPPRPPPPWTTCWDRALAGDTVFVSVGEGGGAVATDLLTTFSRGSGALLLKGSSILATMAFCRSLLSITVVWGTALRNKRITKKRRP